MAITKKDGKLQIYMPSFTCGYFRAKVTEPIKKRCKIMVTCGKNEITYDINGRGDYEQFPFQYGNGEYAIRLYRNVSGSQYQRDGRIDISIELKDPFAPYLAKNQFINWSTSSFASRIKGLFKECGDEKILVSDIKANILSNYSYDPVKANKVKNKTGVLPDILGTFKTRKGICQDIAALAVAMFRIEKIPARMIVGTMNANPHAWCEVWNKDKNKWDLWDPTLDIQSTVDPDKRKYNKIRWY